MPKSAKLRPPMSSKRQRQDGTTAVMLIAKAEALLATGALEETLVHINRLLAANPRMARGHHLLGRVAMALGQPGMALAPLARAVQLEAGFENRMGEVECLSALGRNDDARGRLLEAIPVMPVTAGASRAVGDAFMRLGEPSQAIRFHKALIEIDPADAAAYHVLGSTLEALGEADAAVEAYRAAFARAGAVAAYAIDLSSALSFLGRFAEAIDIAAAATLLDPTAAVAFHNLGHALVHAGRTADAIMAYDQAIQLDPDYVSPRYGRALALLKAGDHVGGWREYEWRWFGALRPRRDLAVPLWQGEPLQGRTILIYGEQGLGDMLQFVRFVPLVAQRGGRVVLQVPQTLVRLLQHMDGVSIIVTDKMPLPPIDLYCPMGSLPLHLSIDSNTIPPGPYLHTADELSRSDRADRVVGLVWAGAPRAHLPTMSQIDQRRSISPALFGPLLDIPGIRFVSFQFGATAEQRSSTGTRLTDALDGVTDFAGTAERLRGIDLLISVDTSIVHLAGGLGLPVWMLSRHDGCWRWLEDRSDTPWYPSMRIFRQPDPGNWISAIKEVRRSLLDWQPTIPL